MGLSDIMDITADDIKKALFEHFRGDEWAAFDELRFGTGWISERTIDFWAMNVWPSKKFQTIAIEIKTSRSDFSREKSNLLKTMPALSLCEKFYFAAPKGVLTSEDMPEWAGLWEYDPETKSMGDRPNWTKANGIGQLFVPSMAFIASILRRQSRLEYTNRYKLAAR